MIQKIFQCVTRLSVLWLDTQRASVSSQLKIFYWSVSVSSRLLKVGLVTQRPCCVYLCLGWEGWKNTNNGSNSTITGLIGWSEKGQNQQILLGGILKVKILWCGPFSLHPTLLIRSSELYFYSSSLFSKRLEKTRGFQNLEANTGVPQ